MSHTSSHLPYPDPDSYFTIGNYINNPEKFYGREKEINTIVNRLKSMQATSIVGERRIGKSSLLYHFYQTGAQKIGKDSYQFVYVDLQNARFQRQDLFLRNILKKLNLSHDLIKPEMDIIDALIEFSDELKKFNGKVVLLVDEFDDGLKEGRFSEEFFEHMRSLISERKIGFVTASKISLKDACLEGGYTSPFYNVFISKNLASLSDEAVAQFIEDVNKDYYFTDFEWTMIKSYCDNEPLKMQIALKQILGLREVTVDDGSKEGIFRQRYQEELGSFYPDAEDYVKAKVKKGVKNWDKILKFIFEIRKELK